MPLAFFLMCHRMPGAVADLLRAIWRADHLYLLHVDAKSGAALHETGARLAAAFPNVHQLPARLCSWGGWSLVETMLRGIELPTLLLGSEAGQGLAIDRRPTTFVAWPLVSGTDDWTFSEDNYFAAREQGFLFTRKRHAELPPRVARAVARLRGKIALPALPVPDERFTRGAPVATLSGALLRALRGKFPGLLVETLAPLRVGGSPACFLRLRCPALPPALHVGLLSEDFCAFKALLAWGRQAEDDFSLRTLGGLPTWLSKVRLRDFSLMREVLLPEVADAGFVTLAPLEGPERLAALLAQVLSAGIAMERA